MLNIAKIHTSVMLFFIIICYKISNVIDTIIQYDVISCLICISTKVEYLNNNNNNNNNN